MPDGPSCGPLGEPVRRSPPRRRADLDCPVRPSRLVADACCALLIGAIVFWLSCLVEAPGSNGFSFGLTYQQMSEAPFAWRGLFPHRVLLPAIAHGLGLDGARFHLAAHGCALLLLVLVFWAARRHRCDLVDSTLLTLACGLGGATQLYKSHVGYPDSLSFVLLLAAALSVRNGAALWGFTLLGALAHEQGLFFVPFLLWLRRALAGADWRRETVAAATVIVAYGAFRWYVQRHAADEIPPSYYFDNGYFPLGFLGVLYLALVQVVLVFGVQLVALPFAYRHGVANPAALIGGERSWQRPALLLHLLAILGIYLVAHDFNRFVNFLFLPLLWSWRELLRRDGGRWLLLGALLLQVIVSRHVVMPVAQQFYAPMVACNCLTGVPRDLQKLITHVLPQVWPWVLGAALLLIGLLAWGWRLGRDRQQGRATPPS